MSTARVAPIVCGLAAFLGAPSFGAAPSPPLFTLHTLELDTGFGTDGEVRGVSRGRVTLTSIDSVRLDAQGRIVVAATAHVAGLGSLSNAYRPAVARFLPDGRLDASFAGGIVVLPARGYPEAVAIDSKGRILVAGSFRPLRGAPRYRSKWAVARVLPDGRRDRRFGAGGLASAAIDRGDRDVIDMETSPVDDSVVVLEIDYDGGAGSLVAKLNSRGRPFAGFGQHGIASVAPEPDRLAIDSAGHVFVGPLRLDASGAPDTAFGVNGFLAAPDGALTYDARVGFDGDGRIVAVGHGPASGPATFRFLADGTPDATFGDAGTAPIRLGTPLADGHGPDAAGGISVASASGGPFAFGATFSAGGDIGFAVQAVDPAAPTDLASYTDSGLQEQSNAAVSILDVVIAPDGAFAIAAGERTERFSSDQLSLALLMKVDLTPGDEVPLPNATLAWQSPVVTFTKNVDGVVEVQIPSAPLLVRNTGAATLPSLLLSVWISDDDTIGPGDRPVADVQIPALPPGESVSGLSLTSYAVLDPAFTGTQGRRLIAVLDLGDGVLETNEFDGVAVSAPLQ